MPRLTEAQYAALLRRQGRPAKPRTTLPAASEHDEQCAVIAWARIMAGRWPELRLLASIPNGGARDKASAAQIAAEGVLVGAPDLALFVQRHGFGALFIEMKTARGRLSPAQVQVHEWLRAAGYLVVVCRSSEEAIRALEHYLEE